MPHRAGRKRSGTAARNDIQHLDHRRVPERRALGASTRFIRKRRPLVSLCADSGRFYFARYPTRPAEREPSCHLGNQRRRTGCALQPRSTKQGRKFGWRDEGFRKVIVFSDVRQAFGNLRAQKTRTLLTALGIVFGVGSVIGMMSIGAGAREESLRFIEQLGVRNILIDSRQALTEEELQQRRRSSPGLTDRDVRILQANIDAVETMSARRTLHPSAVLPKPAQSIPELFGVGPAYALIHSLQF